MDLKRFKFQCLVNDELKQDGNTADMLFPIGRILSILSGWWKLLPGDIIFTGTPEGVGPLRAGDRITVVSKPTGAFSWNVKKG